MKLGKGFWPGVLIAAIIVVGLGLFFGKIDNPFSTSPTGNANGGSVSAAVSTPACAIQPSIAYSLTDKYNGTTIASPTTKLYVGGQLSSCSSSPCNIDIGKTYEVTLSDAQHYKSVSTGTAGCGVNTVAAFADGNATLSNSTADKFGTANAATAIGANDEQVEQLFLAVPSKKTFSNPQSPNNPIICVKYNTTEVTGISLIGATSVGTPIIATGNSETSCWYAPFNHLSNGETSAALRFSIASGSTNPGGYTPITGHVYPQDRFTSVDATQKWGVEDDSGSHTAVGLSTAFHLGYS
jgi:hypothetical protein